MIKFLSLLLLITTCSCNSKPEISGKVTIECEELPASKKMNGVILYFLYGFDNDTVKLSSSCNEAQEKVLTTDMSLSFAGSFSLKRCSGDILELNIKGHNYTFQVKEGFAAIDVRRKNDILSICYHNTVPKILE